MGKNIEVADIDKLMRNADLAQLLDQSKDGRTATGNLRSRSIFLRKKGV